MALLGASFQIGRSALAAYQAAISVVGQNIANVANPDYTRQTGRLSAQYGGPVVGGVAPGIGVRMSGLQRHFDGAVEARLRDALAQRSNAEAAYRTTGQVEALYTELTDQDISTQLSEFFASFSTLQATPEDSTARNLVISSADNLLRTMERIRSGLLRHVDDVNDAVSNAVQRVNAVAGEIATLNKEIVTAEATSERVASALRDRRDALLREMSELTDVTAREQDNGALNLYLGGEPLVEFARSRELAAELVFTDQYALSSVRFADNGGTVTLRDGQLGGLVRARDEHLVGQINRLDELARGIIYEVNRVHADGRGLVGYGTLTSEYRVNDTAAALNSDAADLPFPLSNGVFIVNVRDTETGQKITRQIEIDLDGIGDDTSLADLAAALNAVPGLNASTTSDDRLKITAGAGQDFWFSEDTSGALAALGLGAFFTGTDASTFAIANHVRSDTRMIAASLSGAVGDGDNAGRLATLGVTSSTLLNNQAIEDFHATTVNNLAVAASAALTEFEAADAVHASLVAQREAISGVSLDEEAINLTRFETAYQGSARYLSVLDRLTDEVLALAL